MPECVPQYQLHTDPLYVTQNYKRRYTALQTKNSVRSFSASCYGNVGEKYDKVYVTLSQIDILEHKGGQR